MSKRLPAIALSRSARTSHAGRRRATAARALSAAAFVLLTACQDNAATPTGPSIPAADESQLAAGSDAAAVSRSRDPLSSRLPGTPGACIVAERARDGRYYSRSSTVPIPPEIATQKRTARFAYRGWAAWVPEPVLLAVCTIPDTDAAREYFERQFGGKPMTAGRLRTFAQSAGVADVQDWGSEPSPHVRQGAKPIHVTDGLASEFRARVATNGFANLMEPCEAPYLNSLRGHAGKHLPDPTAIITEPGCDGSVPEEETVPTTPPAPSGEPDFAPLPVPGFSPGVAPAGDPICWGQTDYPHGSTTPGYYGNLSGKSWTSCTSPVPQYVITYLKRESCFLWFFCSWPTIASAISPLHTSATFAIAMANRQCVWRTGWYKGRGYHQAAYPSGAATAETGSPIRYIRCW